MPQNDRSTLVTDKAQSPHHITSDAGAAGVHTNHHNAAFTGGATLHGQTPVGEARALATTSLTAAFVSGGPAANGGVVTPLPVR
jgi:hypothetical protein